MTLHPSLPRLALVVAALGAASTAHAAQYWTNEELLKNFFKSSAHVGVHTFTLTDAEAAEIAGKLGAPLKRTTWHAYVGEDASQRRTGYALLDEEIGLHDYIDYGVRFGLSGAVERVEIRVYREPYGDQVRLPRFRQQFVGKTASDPIVAGKDIDIISGATYSSKAVALGVKRDALILQAALKSGRL
jgi:hypothetical protein